MVRLSALIVVGLTVAWSAHAESLVKRGAYLVNDVAACGDCHTPRGKGGRHIEALAFAGGTVFGSPKYRAVAANITPDRQTGIGSWTDQQVINAIQNGRKPDGSLIGPPMPVEMYHSISDRDLRAIVAYLRTLKPIRHKVAKSVYKIHLHALPPVDHVTAPPQSNKVAYGGYLARVAHCIECHTPMGPHGRDFSKTGAGGWTIHLPVALGGGALITPNITPDPKDGIGKWSGADIKRAITHGVRPDGSKLFPLMPFRAFRKMHPADLDAIVAYLRSLRPV